MISVMRKICSHLTTMRLQLCRTAKGGLPLSSTLSQHTVVSQLANVLRSNFNTFSAFELKNADFSILSGKVLEKVDTLSY